MGDLVGVSYLGCLGVWLVGLQWVGALSRARRGRFWLSRLHGRDNVRRAAARNAHGCVGGSTRVRAISRSPATPGPNFLAFSLLDFRLGLLDEAQLQRG